ncbi:putative amidoligase enzyme-domain-containing protein [Boeremia exigua]|uniref:putative amidoligase enzyme-domain-containing protein n=1 Tax=Boeremia exigua TaxID=749465 RepID=UPI001E8D0B2C|nr:putative amidoligase enzyme-domain-containing protein [Boeremia exigua]KAH6633759.1 putative amidoligase enzyme-domain-containing protein [Boeremia exigua]
MALSKFGFGIEIEAVVKPLHHQSTESAPPQAYYEILASELRRNGLPAVADRLNQAWQAQHPDHYDKWFITKDGSLHGEPDEICLEAVSPVMKTNRRDWKENLRIFWLAMNAVFDVQRNFTCGSHIHVAPQGRKFSMAELKTIAFAVITQEHMVKSLLPRARSTNGYCQRNSKLSPKLIDYFRDGKNARSFATVKTAIQRMTTRAQILDLMQGIERFVIWNFKNIETTHTIEFRGGRHLRGPNRTFWWIAFAVSFISLALKENTIGDSKIPLYVIPRVSEAYTKRMKKFWTAIIAEAERLHMGGHLPEDWHRMKELATSIRS